jgi:hypothetical protein
VAPMGAAGVRLDRALAAAQFSLAGGSEPGAAIAARRTAAGRTHSFRFFRPAGLVKGPRSLKPFGRKISGRKMPLVHTCGIFLPPFFCHADWSTPRAAGRFCFRSFRPLRASAEPRQVMAEKREKGPQGDATTCVAPIGAAGIGRVRPRKLFSCQRSKAPRGYSRPRDCRPPDPLFSFFSALWFGQEATG